jgi:hypothetical protein
MDLKEVGRKFVDWNYLAQDRLQKRTLANKVMNLRVPRNAANFLVI